jgi:hypothetical protein
LAFNVPVPSSFEPLKKFTLPFGVPPAEVTVAVRVTLVPYVEVAGAANVVVVGVAVTVKVPSSMTTV